MSNDNSMTYQDLLQIVELIKSSTQFSEFHLKMGDIEVDLRRAGVSAPAPAELPAPEPARPPQRHGHVGGGELVTEPAQPVRPVPHGTPTAYPKGAIQIKSPMVGTFYRAPEPGAHPFVEVGQEVEPDTTVCIIEVMKLMNSIPAGCRGVVTHILVGDGEPVEFGQIMMVIEPL